jgi:lipopolysaccharide export system protein LptC
MNAPTRSDPEGSPSEAASRSSLAARAVRERSKKIAFWRKALPWTMALIVLLVVGWIGARSVVSFFIQRAASGVIHMTKPRFYGKDEKGRSFLIAAKEATRVPGQVDRIILEGPQLVLELSPTRRGSASAARGVYQEKTRVLNLTGTVKFDDGAGNRFLSDKAEVDTKTWAIHGESGVVGEGPIGRITASSYAITDDGKHALFTGGVKAHLVN